MLNRVLVVTVVVVAGVIAYQYYRHDGVSKIEEGAAGVDGTAVSSMEPGLAAEVRVADDRVQSSSPTDTDIPPPLVRSRIHHQITDEAETIYIVDPITDTRVAAPPVNDEAGASGVQIVEIPQPLSDKPLLLVHQESLAEREDAGPIYAVDPLTGIRKKMKPLTIDQSKSSENQEIPSPFAE